MRPGKVDRLLGDSPHFETNALRVENRDALAQALAPLFAERRGGEWVDILHRRSGVPCSILWTREQVLNDEHVHAAGHIQSVETPAGPLQVSGPPWTFSEANVGVSAPPVPGAHTQEVMREIGHELDELIHTAETVLSTF